MSTPILSPILARMRRAARAFAGSDSAAISPATSFDFQPGGWGAHRRMEPMHVRWIIEQAARGSLDAQWELFALMEDSWPRLSKNLNELRNAAARATYTVQPFARRGEKPTASAKERAALVEDAMRQWWPRPGTLELSFENTLYHLLDAYGKGVSVLEVHWENTPDGIQPRAAHALAPRRYGFNPDGTELGLRTADNSGWEPFAQDHFLVGIWHARTGAPGATAVLRALAPYWCGITFGWEWLMSNAQIFGVPFRWATYDKQHPELANQLLAMLEQMAAVGYGAFPDGTKLEFKEAATNMQGNPQLLIQEMACKECDLLILGQELSGGAHAAGLGSGASNLQGSVRADRMKVATQWCADLLNYQLVPAVLRLNYGDTTEPPLIVADTVEETDAVKLAQRDKILLDAGTRLPREWFYARHGIPIPVDGEETIGGEPAAADKTTPPDQTDKTDQPDQTAPDKKPPVKAKAAPPSATAALYDARAIALLTDAQRKALEPLLSALREFDAMADRHDFTGLEKLQTTLNAQAPRILADPALADAWEKVISPPAAEGAAQTAKP